MLLLLKTSAAAFLGAFQYVVAPVFQALNSAFHVRGQLFEKLLARNQQRPVLPRSNRFGVYRPEPSHPDQLCKTTSPGCSALMCRWPILSRFLSVPMACAVFRVDL